jgi:hypothetical protein
VRRRLTGHADGDRQFVDILMAVQADGLDAVEVACAAALSAGLFSRDVVLNHLARRHTPAGLAPLAPPAGLRLDLEPVADCARYDTLKGGLRGAA